jgi:hypothetical protein
MPEIVVTSSSRDINNSMGIRNSRDGSAAETTATARTQGKQRAAITSAIARSIEVAETAGTSRAATSKGTIYSSSRDARSSRNISNSSVSSNFAENLSFF